MKFWQFIIFVFVFVGIEFIYRFISPAAESYSTCSNTIRHQDERETVDEGSSNQKNEKNNFVKYNFLEVDYYNSVDSFTCLINDSFYSLGDYFGKYGKIVLIRPDAVFLHSAIDDFQFYVLTKKIYLTELERQKDYDSVQSESFRESSNVVD